MRVLIIGNGVAGTMAAKTLRELDSKVEIDILTEEKYHYYPRPNLIDFLAGLRPLEKIFAFPGEWSRRQQIGISLATPVRRLDPEKKVVELANGKKEKFDSLLLSPGASASLPPIKGVNLKGVFSLRSIDDALQILEWLRTHNKVVVIGGGLLGLETARSLKQKGAEVVIVEFFDRLLPRQLDTPGARVLEKQIEAMGIQVLTNKATEEIIGPDEVRGVKLKSGEVLAAGLVIIAAGIKPNVSLASEAGIKVNKGVVVDDYLRTSHSDIYAAGDVAEHRGRLYGIIPAAFDQARAAAFNILRQAKPYEGTVPSNSLKVMGISLTSVGLIQGEGEGFEEIRQVDEARGIYKKIVLEKGRLVGAIWMGTKKGVNELVRAVTLRVNVEQWKDSLLTEDFDFAVL